MLLLAAASSSALNWFRKNSRGRYSVCCALLPMVQLHGSIFWWIITVRFSFPKLMVQTTPVLKWSMGMIYIIMMIGLGLLSLYFVYVAVCSLFEKKAVKPAVSKTAEQIAEEVE